MPIYEYECEKCGRIIEVIQKFSDAPLTECECRGPLRKLVSHSSFHLKGSGWYVTDYKGKNAGSAGCSKSCDDSAKSSTETTGGKTESKSAGTTE